MADTITTTIVLEAQSSIVQTLVFLGTVAGGTGGGAVAPIAVAFGDAPRTVFAPTVAGVVTGARFAVTTPFNGASPSLTLGTVASPEAVLAAADTDLTQPWEFDVATDFALTAGQALWLAITPGAGASAGAGTLFLTFTPD